MSALKTLRYTCKLNKSFESTFEQITKNHQNSEKHNRTIFISNDMTCIAPTHILEFLVEMSLNFILQKTRYNISYVSKTAFSTRIDQNSVDANFEYHVKYISLQRRERISKNLARVAVHTKV